VYAPLYIGFLTILWIRVGHQRRCTVSATVRASGGRSGRPAPPGGAPRRPAWSRRRSGRRAPHQVGLGLAVREHPGARDDHATVVHVVADRDAAVRPLAGPGHAVPAHRRALDDRRLLELGQAAQELEQELPDRRGGVERLGGAPDRDAGRVQVVVGVEQGSEVPPEPVQAVDQDAAEAAVPGVGQQPPSGRALGERDGAGDAVVHVDAGDGQLVQVAVAARGSRSACLDRLALGLVLGGDPCIAGDGLGALGPGGRSACGHGGDYSRSGSATITSPTAGTIEGDAVVSTCRLDGCACHTHSGRDVQPDRPAYGPATTSSRASGSGPRSSVTRTCVPFGSSVARPAAIASSAAPGTIRLPSRTVLSATSLSSWRSCHRTRSQRTVRVATTGAGVGIAAAGTLGRSQRVPGPPQAAPTRRRARASRTARSPGRRRCRR
jgi:hypothetical protein